ncbi:hypothetical protein F7725_009021, partial [Dissostichus mawsoni]
HLHICFFVFPHVSFRPKDSQETCDIYAATGDNVNVPLDHKLIDTERLKWTYNNDQILFNRFAKTTIVRGKKDDIHENGSLWLKSVTMSNKGAYKPEVWDKSGKTIGKGLKNISLCVLERAPKPSLTFECKNTFVILTCDVAKKQPPGALKVEWLKNDKKEAKDKGKWKVTEDAKQSDSFRCSVSNQVGVMKSDAVTHNCNKNCEYQTHRIHSQEYLEIRFYTARNTLDGKIDILGKDIFIWIIVAGGGGLVLLLIILVIICCVCTKWKNRRRRQEMRLEWTKKDLHKHQHAQNPPTTILILLSSSSCRRTHWAQKASLQTRPRRIPESLKDIRSPAPAEPLRCPDQLRQWMKSSLLLFLSPGRKVPELRGCDITPLLQGFTWSLLQRCIRAVSVMEINIILN